ncbi:MAG TPA: PaaI family thioesterase [Acidimicrobiales bacterium]|nr:PaaI family thioesterase [Acidimicrobiales bacterium]
MSDPDPYDLVSRVGSMREADVPPQRSELRRLAEATRLMIERMVATKAPAEELARAATALEEVAAALEGFPRGHLFQGFGESANSGDPHAHFDHSPIIGRANPLAPPLTLDVVDGQVVGEATFGSAYEGPPGAVHGGHVAAAFDELLGMAQSLGGKPGMTGTLTVRYRRPHPLHTPISFEATLVRVEGRKIFTEGRSFAGGELRAEAEGIFISVDFSKIAELMRRPAAPGGEPG